MSEDKQPDWVSQVGEVYEALLDKISEAPTPKLAEQVVQAAQQFALDTRLFKTSAGRPLTVQVASMMDAALSEIPPVSYADLRRQIAALADSLMAMSATTSSGSVALPPMGFSGQRTVEKRRGSLPALSEGQIVVLVLVWLFAFVLPVLGPDLSSKLHAVLSDSYATFALALVITWRIRDKQR